LVVATTHKVITRIALFIYRRRDAHQKPVAHWPLWGQLATGMFTTAGVGGKPHTGCARCNPLTRCLTGWK
jgi:hypothetical protein